MQPIYDDARKPITKQTGVVVQVVSTPIPFKRDTCINIGVHIDSYGIIEDVTGMFCGKHLTFLNYSEKREAYHYLQEWELISMRPIGPEDSEWFANKSLNEEYGLEYP